MTGASIEATLELWASSLRDVKARMRPLFTQERVAVSAQRFVPRLCQAGLYTVRSKRFCSNMPKSCFKAATEVRIVGHGLVLWSPDGCLDAA